MAVGINSWDYSNKHVDQSISENQFMSSSRCIIYAQADEGGTDASVPGAFRPIGILQGYSWSEQRQIDMIFELGSEKPFMIPGRTTGQISLSRMLLYGKDVVNTLYGSSASPDPTKWIKSLKDITKPVNLLFATFANVNDQNEGGQVVYSRLFEGCWITARGENIAAGQTLIAENCSIMYQQISNVDIAVA